MIMSLLISLCTLLIVVIGVAGVVNRFAPLSAAKLMRAMMRHKAGLKTNTLVMDGQRFPYLEGGIGEPMILIHGFTANKDTFNAMARYLTPLYKLYIPDLPGFGDATRDQNGDYSCDAFVEYVRKFAISLGLKHVHLCGSSMGGAVVAHLAAKYPDEVASLWLIDAAATHEFLTESDLIKQYDKTGNFPYLVTTHQQHDRKLEMILTNPKNIPYCMRYALAEAAIKDHSIHRSVFEQIRPTSPIELMYSGLHTPTLIVTGDQDRVVSSASVHTLAKVFINNTIKTMHGAGHAPMIERPKESAADYAAFRAKLSAAA